MEILALDLGDKRVGVARAREGIAFPLEIIPRTSIISYLKKYHKASLIDTLVVGLPYDLYGVDEKQLQKTQVFIEKLQYIFPDIFIVGVDERFSSFLALSDSLGRKDASAAQIILDSYLQKSSYSS